ncbi:unnamed protein product [Phytomonas sp. EM1]|nr:unnamed protein product [Phytomonas sp. EM1]|eukprot:CCW59885.1 unnamed protein product [Phytomonas sp. isolate EM1]
MSKKLVRPSILKTSETQRSSKNLANITPSIKTPQTLTIATSGSSANFSRGSRTEMELLFDKLKKLDKGDSPDVIYSRGIEQLCSELSIRPNSLEMFVLMWRLRAVRDGCVSRNEWLSLIYNCGVLMLSQLKDYLNESVRIVQEREEEFYSMYNFLYDFIRGENNRRMPAVRAVQAWKVFFVQKKDLVDRWNGWILEEYKYEISRDLWGQTAVFFLNSKQQGKDNNNHTTDLGQRSSAIDDFCKWKSPISA